MAAAGRRATAPTVATVSFKRDPLGPLQTDEGNQEPRTSQRNQGFKVYTTASTLLSLIVALVFFYLKVLAGPNAPLQSRDGGHLLGPRAMIILDEDRADL